MKNPCRSRARAKLKKKLLNQGKTYQEVEQLIKDISTGKLAVNSFASKIIQRYASVLDPNNWKECYGEAHANPYIDHCMVCLPNWGLIWSQTKGEEKHDDSTNLS